MKKNYKYIFILQLLLIFVLTTIYAQGPIKLKIVVNSKNPITELKRSQISNLFLKKVTRWETDLDVYPIDLVAGSSVRDEFSESIHGKSVAVIKAYWQTQIFAGRAVPPSEKETDTEVLQYVNKNKGAIGYVSGKTDLKKYDVKTIKISN